MKFKTNKRYFFIYLISIILMVSIWGVTTDPPNEPQLQRQSSATEKVAVVMVGAELFVVTSSYEAPTYLAYVASGAN